MHVTARINLTSLLVVVNFISVEQHRAFTTVVTLRSACDHPDFDVTFELENGFPFATRQIPLHAGCC